MNTTVIVSISVEGFHWYGKAPNEVDFLRNKHRHNFIINCGIAVNDLDREVEIFIWRDKVLKYLCDLYGVPCQFNQMSCEMIANEILNYFIDNKMIWCEVWEESTGGARVDV